MALLLLGGTALAASTPGAPQKNDAAIQLLKEGQPDDEALRKGGD